jgi:hypothetical protein
MVFFVAPICVATYPAFTDRSKNQEEKSMPTKLITQTGEQLMNMNLPPTRMIVSGLIPQGLHILGGAPKIGKSWLTLWLCLQVARGSPVWNLLTEQGTVLYLSLEDSFCRIQDRLLTLTDEVIPTIHFAVMADTIAGGLVKQIEDFLADYPDTNFIAIDTLQRVRNVSGDLNAYANDYRDINILKSVADKYSIAILLVHHLRKQGDDDPLNMVSGTTGLTGAVDSIYILKKEKRTGRAAKFIATGRDIEQREYTLEFDKQSHLWNFVSDDSDEPFSLSADKVLSEVVDFIRREEIFIGSASELAEKMQTKTLPNILSKKLIQNQAALLEQGIQYSYSRTGHRREITLLYDSNDSNDGNDGKNDSGSVPDLLSQLSLPSQTG